MKKFMAVLFCLLLAQPTFAQDAPAIKTFLGQTKSEKTPDAKTPDKRQPNVEIWLPPEFQSSEKKWPLIIFSHGFGGCAKQSEFLTKYLADQGYIVIAPDHEDSRCKDFSNNRMGGGLQSRQYGKNVWPEKPFRNPENWTDKTEVDRKDDIEFALASMLDDRQYKNYIDLDHIGLMGHSLGGYTVLGIAGAWPAWKDKRFKAVLAMSPFMTPFLSARSLYGIDIPVMYQGGTRDDGITPFVSKRGGGYDQTRAPKYYFEFKGAGHMAWTDSNHEFQSVVQKTALDFFDKYLKEKPLVIEYEAGKGNIADFRKDESTSAKKK